MQIELHADKRRMGAAAAALAASRLREALAMRDSACLIVATGASQFEMLAHLVREPGVQWDRVTAFHLDEYVGIAESHPASFRRYLRERFVEHLPRLQQFHYVNAETDASAECQRLAGRIRDCTVDVACIGIGENGHLAFNDPPADFETETPYLVVDLDDACRRQQLGEGWFPTLDDVPRKAISMSIRQILKAHTIVCTVPDARKAVAVRNAVEGPLTPDVPASVLRQHPACHLFLDPPAASLLRADTMVRRG